MTQPHLSIVATSRNDDHGGDALERTSLFVRGLLEQTRRHELAAELVLVEWNPPGDRPRLHEVLPRPGGDDLLTIRYVEVPSEIHRRYRNSEVIPLYQMTAKNVGIRRSRGRFVLCTNIDLLFSDPLMRELSGPLDEAAYYRANRCDVPTGIDPSWGLDEQLDWCRRNIIRRLGRDPQYKNISLEQAGLDDKAPYKKWIFDKMALAMMFFWSPQKRAFYQLDCFACGDFTMMSRDAWEEIEGYLEVGLYSLHIDSLGLVAAAALGYRQHVFPLEACTYHMEHTMGWMALGPLDRIRFLEERPALDYSLVVDAALYALERREKLGLNSDSWGHADTELEETVFPASWDEALVAAAGDTRRGRALWTA